MKIVISSGHGLYIRGASGFLDEVDEARRVVDRVAELWRSAGVGVDVFHDNTSTSQNENLNAIVNYHNSRTRNLDCSVHFNAFETTTKPMGVEVLYVTQSSLASELSAAIADTASLPNRGGKLRNDLFFLNNTEMPAILIETCFVDSSVDADQYRDSFDDICRIIAEIVGQIDIGEPPDIEEPPVEPPSEAENNRVDITAKTTGSVIIDLNGQEFVHGEADTLNRLVLTLKIEGAVTVTINGQDYHNEESTPPPPIKDNHRNIITTTFGGVSDPNNSAYPPYDFITDSERSVALPYKFTEPRPKVRVFNAENELSVTCAIRDVGPWHVDDAAYVLGDARPKAEPPGSIIDGGPNDGRASNGAGLDLTPAAAEAIELSGKGICHWMFEDETPTA